ncbi:MAG: HAMP domain-containing histidine kinase [Nitrospirae bacterium]|nr:HAMP domain-containing histidine kinase [Nitrospirota bacterium]
MASIDYLTVKEIGFTIFYLLPIVFASWFLDRQWGLFLSFTSTLVLQLFNTWPKTHLSAILWDSIVIFIVYAIITVLLVELKKKLARDMDRHIMQNQLLSEQEKLIARNKEFLNRTEKFISVLLHDLKGPLTPIIWFTERLLKDKPQSEEEFVEALEIIKRASDTILQHIQETSKALKDKNLVQSFNPRDIDITQVIQSVAKSFLPRAEANGLKLLINGKDRMNWDTLESIIVVSDMFQMKTLVENLIGNAVKYANSSINVNIGETDSNINIDISDDGSGIQPEYQDQIFREYFQVPNSKEGTGLGLYSVKTVVTNHKGTIDVQSTPGKGATFRVSMPVKSGWKGQESPISP